jgi:hypothetical protein
MPQREPAVVNPHSTSEDTSAQPNRAVEQNRAAIEFVNAWLREDTPTLFERIFSHRSDEPDSWDHLKEALDSDRPSARKLFQ